MKTASPSATTGPVPPSTPNPYCGVPSPPPPLPAVGVLPARPGVAGPARRRDRRVRGAPVGDPEDLVAVVGEPAGVAHVAVPEGLGRVDHRSRVELRVDPRQPGLLPALQVRRPEAPAGL